MADKQIIAGVHKKFQTTYGKIPLQENSSRWVGRFEATSSVKK
jgi:hypothetical protein